MNRILIVEDELSLSDVLSKGIKELGFEVITAENGKEGLDKALKDHPDLILTDILMPEMDGMAMVSKLREDLDYGAKAKVIILTNLQPDTAIIKEAIKGHPSYFLEKSKSSLNVIFEMVKKLLNENQEDSIETSDNDSTDMQEAA